MFNEKELQNVHNKTSLMYEWIRTNIKEGSVILEFGSGVTTRELGKYYIMYSVESDKNWLYKYSANYIFAPIVDYNESDPAPKGFPQPNNGWYDIENLKNEIPPYYDFIIVDGPVGATSQDAGRAGFYKHLDLFRKDIPILFHDVNRPLEKLLVEKVSNKLNKPFQIFTKKESIDIAVIS